MFLLISVVNYKLYLETQSHQFKIRKKEEDKFLFFEDKKKGEEDKFLFFFYQLFCD